MKKIIVIFIVVAFGSCNTVAKQQRKAETFYAEHPELNAINCIQHFPIDTVFKQGQIIVKSDTTIIKGDSVPCPSVINEQGETVYVKVKCPDSKIIHDTVKQVDTFTVTDNAKLAYLHFQNDSLKTALIQSNTQRDDARNGAKNRLWWIIGMAVALAGSIFINIKKFT